MFVSTEEQSKVVEWDGVEYTVFFIDLSAHQDDVILQRALTVRGAPGRRVEARSRIAEINKARFLAMVRRVEYTTEDGDAKTVTMDAAAYISLSRGFRNAVQNEVINPISKVTPEEEEDFPDLLEPSSTGSS